MDATRQSRLETVHKAISENRAYLDTAWGKRLVISYRDDSGWAVTNNTGSTTDQRSFMVTLESIQITNKPCFEDRRTVKHSSFEYEGKTIPVTSSEVERVWNW